jgi:hypothetical protein
MNLNELRELAEDKAVEFFTADRLDHYEERLVARRNLEHLTQGGLIQAIHGLHRLRKKLETELAETKREHDLVFQRLAAEAKTLYESIMDAANENENND